MTTSGFDLFRKQAAGEYDRLRSLLPGNRPYVIAKTRQVVRQLQRCGTLPELTEAERFWLEVIQESFEELIQQAGGTI